MANIFGENLSKKEVLKKMGDISQCCNVKEYVLSSGKAKGVKCIDVESGAGLQFTIVADRGMDIAWCRYNGVPISYITKNGIVAPSYYSENRKGFFRNFFAGLLTTCGLRNTGPSCNVDDENFAIHDLIANIPAENLSISSKWQQGDCYINISGVMRQTCFFGENLSLSREISLKLGENKFKIKDTVENHGFNNEPIMMLYHYNFGYPLISEKAKLVMPSIKVIPRDEDAEQGINRYDKFENPMPEYKEQVFFHEFNTNEVKVGVFNPELGSNGVGCYIKYDKNELPILTQWKQMGEGEYVLGLEPANCLPLGRDALIKEKTIPTLMSDEKVEFEFELGFVDCVEDMY